MKNISDKLERINLELINILVLFTGILLTFFGVFIKGNKNFNWISLTGNDIRTILVSIGTSLIASSIIAFLSSRYLIKQNEIKNIIDEWGLEAIYETRAQMNESSNEKLNNVKHDIDIIAFGFRGFRDAKGDIIEKKIENGVKFRILTINPNSKFLEQREKDEMVTKGTIKSTIEELEPWVKKLQGIAPKKENVQIKYYDSLPLDSYLREDDRIYIGPYIYKRVSQQTISYEFSKNLRGYNYYKGYFEKLWNDENFAKDDY